MGVIDKMIDPQHPSFEVDSPWVTEEELGNGLGIFLGSFKGQLSVSVAFNDAWHKSTEALAFVADCNKIVSDGLGIDIS